MRNDEKNDEKKIDRIITHPGGSKVTYTNQFYCVFFVFCFPFFFLSSSSGYLINITTVSKSKRSAAMLDTYGSNQNEYVAAEIAKSGEDTVFTLGDGKNYSDYYNAPLQKDREYSMSIGVCSKTDEVGPTPSPPGVQPQL